MFDHIGIPASDLAKSKEFFLKALAPIGVEVVMEFPGAVGIGQKGKPSFWLGESEGGAVPGAMHLAFTADNREQVRAFYDAAMAAGAKDNGGPGLRPQYHATYYGAFVIGPDGHNVEVVCHKPEG